MKERLTPQLWSDFDGTAVKIARARYINPKNWLKMGLAGIPGYADFLLGAQQAGVEIAGVVSRRPDVWQRRFATQLAINYQDLWHFFDPPARVLLAGSEERKAATLVAESHKAPVALIEDKPHNIGPLLLQKLIEHASDPTNDHHPITVGVVDHPNGTERFDATEQALRSIDGAAWVGNHTEGSFTMHLAERRRMVPLLKVVPIGPYSVEAGQQFASSIRRV